MSGRPNVVFFFPDELRADALGTYGNPLVSTPAHDRLAREGVRFDQCHVQHTVCSPSRCSLFTGLYAHTTGHRTLWHLLRPHEPSLFRTLRDAGYAIRWFGKNDVLSDAYVREILGGEAVRPDVPPERTFTAAPGPAGAAAMLYRGSGDADSTEDAANLRRALAFLRSEEARRRPFFLYLPFSLPHPPYVAPEPYASLVDPADVPPLRPAGLPGKPSFVAHLRRYRGLEGAPERLFREVRATYLGMVAYADALLGTLLDELDATGLAASTVVVATSDHGDWAGDWGLVEKWPSGLDDPLTRVPLIVRAPGARAGHVVEPPVELFDVGATILELTGLPPDHGDARSLVPELRGAPGDDDAAAFADGGYDLREPHAFEGAGAPPPDPDDPYGPKLRLQTEHPASVCRSATIRTLTHRLVVRTEDVTELYDLRRDPDELRNVATDPAYAGVRAELTERLLQRWLHTADVVPLDRDRRGFPPP